MNLVFLPATEPGDETFGKVPESIAACGTAAIHEVRFPRMVWYNQAVCAEAVAQVRSFGAASVTLIGFSKSGLGAWSIARALPGCIVRTIIFDAPMVRHTLPPWGTEPFYADDIAWQNDLPLLTITAYKAAVPASHQLILISGASFHDEMSEFSLALAAAGVEHLFLPRPQLPHHWNSGWIEEGLNAKF